MTVVGVYVDVVNRIVEAKKMLRIGLAKTFLRVNMGMWGYGIKSRRTAMTPYPHNL